MMPTPLTSFEALDDAMTRITALLGMIATGVDPDWTAQRLEEQIARAVDAHAHLTTGSEAIAEIRAFLLATYGGQPGRQRPDFIFVRPVACSVSIATTRALPVI